MDPNSVQSTPSIEQDEWDTDGFVIPSLTVGESGVSKPDVPEVSNLKPPSPKQVIKDEEKIYLGPHGAPPSQGKQQELNAAVRKQRLRHKLKEADRKFTGTGRENKMENLRELVGSKVGVAMAKGSPRDWLDPHCHESHFEKYSQ
ncbi:Na-translocating NADH-quinone reductase subunit A [Tasmannia lanceolata]|uniref:Na-translocating NADH-quinone reductase subunit A n=1 Tax=Tasmannia lanceolata TaxID=3420 RepID=UPI004062D36A